VGFGVQVTKAWHAIGLGGGILGSAPSVGTDPHGDQYVFWKGGDNNLWEAWYVS
jgi:hypothetical protein